jgi:cobalt-zinc-cadmium efflux system membrane fusion protein
MNKKRWIILGWLGAALTAGAVVAISIAAVQSEHDQKTTDNPSTAYALKGDSMVVDADAARKAGIAELTVQTRDVPLSLTLTGRTGLNMDSVTHVHAQFGGKVINVGPELGARVDGPTTRSTGTVLCVIESNDLAQAKAIWVQASVQLKLDADALERTRELVKSTVLAPKFLIDAESAVTKDKAALEAARQQLLIFGLTQKEIDDIQNQVGRQRMDYVIASPRSGVVAEKGVAGGEIADPTVNLFTITDTSTMWVWGDVYERDLPLIKVGQPARIVFTSEPDRPRDCKIEWISPSLDPNTHSIRIRATIPNSDSRLLADMYGTLFVTIDPGANSIVIPTDAVVRRDNDAYVFVREEAMGNKTRYRRTPVTMAPLNAGFGDSSAASSALDSAARNSAGAARDAGLIRVTAGLKPGDVIVQTGTLGLYNEMEEQAKDQ